MIPRQDFGIACCRTFDAFDRHMRETLPDIYKSSYSWNSMLKLVNETYRDGDPVFNDGFESGNTSAWSSETP